MAQQGAVQEATRWLLQHGYLLLVAAVTVEQLGVPVPAAPLLLAMGALAGYGHFNIVAALALSTLAALSADFVWFQLGRRRGESILGVLCRVSLEPDSCVRLTHQAFDRYGPASLLFCKFVPGLSTVAPPMAGSSGMSTGRFVLLDLAGSSLWAGAFLTTGWLFRRETERALEVLSQFGTWFFVALFAPLLLWLTWKYAQRRRWFTRDTVPRVRPEELRDMLASGEPPVIIDLRPKRTVQRSGLKIASAFVLDVEELNIHLRKLPSGSHLVFYCT
jgi:membrane protein DedA with SNARE-associated domain